MKKNISLALVFAFLFLTACHKHQDNTLANKDYTEAINQVGDKCLFYFKGTNCGKVAWKKMASAAAESEFQVDFYNRNNQPMGIDTVPEVHFVAQGHGEEIPAGEVVEVPNTPLSKSSFLVKKIYMNRPGVWRAQIYMNNKPVSSFGYHF